LRGIRNRLDRAGRLHVGGRSDRGCRYRARQIA